MAQLVRWGSVLAVASAVYQFVTNLHTVPITGRTQVVVLSREEECVRLWTIKSLDQSLATATQLTAWRRNSGRTRWRRSSRTPRSSTAGRASAW